MKYAIIIEKAAGNYSAYAPDVPGCVATGDTPQEIRRNMAEALAFHFEGLVLDGERIPKPQSECDYVEVSMPEAQKKSRGRAVAGKRRG